MESNEEINRPDPADIGPSVVSFLDILGFSNIIRDQERSLELFEAVSDAVEKTRAMIKNLTSERQTPFSLTFRVFSDNIIVSCGYNPGAEDPERCWQNTVAITSVLMVQAVLQTDLLCNHGILSRGGTVLGDYFRNDDFVFGRALVDAYNLEETADTPRMVVDEKVVETYSESATRAQLPISDAILGHLFMRDSDLETYVHYLNASSILENILSQGKTPRNGPSLLDEHRRGLMKAIADNKKSILEDRKLRRKYAWAVRYHNDVVEMSKFGEPIDLSILYE